MNEKEILAKGRFVYKTDQEENIIAYALENEDSDASEDASLDSDKSYTAEEVGRLNIENDSQGNVWLNHVEVNQSYKRKKIASTMMKLAIDHLDLTHIPCVKEASQYRLSLTAEGERFIAGCLKKNIITPDMCYFSTLSDERHSPFILEDEAVDPGLDSLTVLEACDKYKEKPKKSLNLTKKPIGSFFNKVPVKKDEDSSTSENSDDENVTEKKANAKSSSKPAPAPASPTRKNS